MNPMKLSNAFLGLGSNLGDRLQSLQQAVHHLQDQPEIEVDFENGLAPIYETAPMGVSQSQQNYFNTTIRIQTTLTPMNLLHTCLQIESEMGRVRQERWGSRMIDIDLLLFDDLVFNDDELMVPHPRMHQRLFVLEPLSRIAGEITHPVRNETIHTILSQYKLDTSHDCNGDSDERVTLFLLDWFDSGIINSPKTG